MSTKPNTLSMAQSAVYHHALAFSPYWGDAEQLDEGTISFRRLPKGLETLKIQLGFNKRWMGGTCAMNIIFSCNTVHSDSGKIAFKGAHGGTFTGKTRGDFSSRLLTALNTDEALKKTLYAIDLTSVYIDVKHGMVECTVTPYGGGMAYLVIPPIRTPIPLPGEQVLPLTQAIEAISVHIKRVQH